jgi:predicted nicotinamide N-methyase
MSVTELSIPGGWSEREVAVGPLVLKLLTPADPDEFLNHLVEPSDTGRPYLADPYWAKLWPAATDLAAGIWRSFGPESQVGCGPASTQRLRCLELGCGSGLVGVVALAVGLDVTLSDYVPQAVELALENASRNGLSGGRGLVLDWRTPTDDQFPLIVAADVTYDRTNLPPLLDVLDRMLAPGGEAWFGDAGRGPAAEFLHLATSRGWLVRLLDEADQPVLVPILGRYQKIVLRRVS